MYIYVYIYIYISIYTYAYIYKNLYISSLSGLISSEEMIHSATVICDSLKKIPCIGDGDTGRNISLMRYIYIYVFICMQLCTYLYIYIYILKKIPCIGDGDTDTT
jgi:hypothetical protein